MIEILKNPHEMKENQKDHIIYLEPNRVQTSPPFVPGTVTLTQEITRSVCHRTRLSYLYLCAKPSSSFT